MPRQRAAYLTISLLALGTVAWSAVHLLVGELPPPTPNPPGTFSFAAMGDAPYNAFEHRRFRSVLEDLAAHDLSFVIHVGDLFWEPCTTVRYRESLEELDRLPHPVVYTPGDNEWTDCWDHRRAFEPLERLEEIRRIFFADPTSSLGERAIPLESQSGSEAWSEYVENARWTHAGVVFATLHLVGSGNGTARWRGRTEADDEESRRRTEAAASWLHETFREAEATQATAAVLAFHGYPHFEDAADSPSRRALEPFLEALEQETEAFGRPVLVVHGDWHEYTVDHPVVRRSTGRRLANLTRLEVPGSPRVGWVRVVVDPEGREPFVFEPRVVSGWKPW
ncbi:MAG TPA: metallophosphoesterase [Longimicrobiales bacterium]|nr:metallophosphoesterase [Longimicrobiales bacterium]